MGKQVRQRTVKSPWKPVTKKITMETSHLSGLYVNKVPISTVVEVGQWPTCTMTSHYWHAPFVFHAFLL